MRLSAKPWSILCAVLLGQLSVADTLSRIETKDPSEKPESLIDRTRLLQERLSSDERLPVEAEVRRLAGKRRFRNERRVPREGSHRW